MGQTKPLEEDPGAWGSSLGVSRVLPRWAYVQEDPTQREDPTERPVNSEQDYSLLNTVQTTHKCIKFFLWYHQPL